MVLGGSQNFLLRIMLFSPCTNTDYYLIADLQVEGAPLSPRGPQGASHLMATLYSSTDAAQARMLFTTRHIQFKTAEGIPAEDL
jgi:hypothetical protein